MSSDLPGFFQGTEMPDATWWQALFPNPAQILTLVGLAPGMDAVDLCSGDGWFTLAMAKIARHVMAVDIDAKMLAHASTRLTRDRITNCDYQLGDAYGLAEYVPRPVDFVFMANSFHGVPDRERLARIVGEALKPGGRFAIVNWHQLPREKRFDPDARAAVSAVSARIRVISVHRLCAGRPSLRGESGLKTRSRARLDLGAVRGTRTRRALFLCPLLPLPEGERAGVRGISA